MSASVTAARQLPLPLPIHDDAAAEHFIAAPANEAARAWLAQGGADGAEWPLRRLAVFGPEGSGKTHLARLWAARAGATPLPGPALALLRPHGPILLDDADLAEERPLLHLINATAEAGFALLLVGREPPARWPVRLPDLASRLRATASAGIAPPDDALLAALLARLFAARGLAVPRPVQDWLLARLPRTTVALRRAVARLDRASLAAGRAITRPLAAAALADLLDAPDDDFTAEAALPPVLL